MKVLLKAARFAAERHAAQTRKNAAASPYIIHPIETAELLAGLAGVEDEDILAAALLHDVLEDTSTTPDEIAAAFGQVILKLVLECTDDKRLPRSERKRIQIVKAPGMSPRAKMIKLADKIVNLRSVLDDPPAAWSMAQRRDYADWAGRVIAALGAVHPALDREARRRLRLCRTRLRDAPVTARRPGGPKAEPSPTRRTTA